MQPFLGAPCLERYSEDAEPIWLAISNFFHLQVHSVIEFCYIPGRLSKQSRRRDYLQGLN